MKLSVLEIFGPTIQGEGMMAGKKTMFVRTAGCDYSCAWCDSAFTWDGSAKEEIDQMSPEEVVNELERIGQSSFSHVTISGGNPGLLKNLGTLISLLHSKGIEVGLETQGSRYQDWFCEVDQLTLSPKPPSSKMTTNWDTLDLIVNELVTHKRIHHTSLKVVIFNEEDLAYAKTVHQRYPQFSFYLQPGNDDVLSTDDTKIKLRLLEHYDWLIDQVVKEEEWNDVTVLPQLHALVWGNKRGV